jgi:hypothetical protein
MDSEAQKRKKKKIKKRTLLDPEEVYSELISRYNTSLSETQQDAYPAPTPMKRRTEDSSPGPDTESKRKVLFNLKLNRTQHFSQDDIVANADLSQRLADLSPPKSLLKAPGTDVPHKKKRKSEGS